MSSVPLSTRQIEIVSVAREIFASRGYRNTSMRDIADACGMLAGSLYSHFRAKAEILRFILEPFYDRVLPAQEAAAALAGPGAARLEAMLRRVFPVLIEGREELTILHYDWYDLVGVDELAGIVERGEYAIDLWHRVIVAGIGDGSLRPEIDPEVTVRVIFSALQGLLDRKRFGTRPDPVTQFGGEVLTDELVTLVLSGLGTVG
jgi:AcrR family transcriptional regulator